MGRISNAMNEKRLNIMDKILDKMDYELGLISPSNSIDQCEKLCKNVITLADTFNRLDLWVFENNDRQEVKE
jgi:hypothetical protein